MCLHLACKINFSKGVLLGPDDTLVVWKKSSVRSLFYCSEKWASFA